MLAENLQQRPFLVTDLNRFFSTVASNPTHYDNLLVRLKQNRPDFPLWEREKTQKVDGFVLGVCKIGDEGREEIEIGLFVSRTGFVPPLCVCLMGSLFIICSSERERESGCRCSSNLSKLGPSELSY